MTAEEFKKLKPEYQHLQGEELWSAMENYMLEQQAGNEVLKQIMPIWKTHTLRWLFYRKRKYTGPIHIKHHQSETMCTHCKKGVSGYFGFIVYSEPKESKIPKPKGICPHCHADYHPIPNTNLSYKIYKIQKYLSDCFWTFLDRIHLIRNTYESRYDVFGDESRYVESWRYDKDWIPLKPVLKKRKWWEYILIEKRNHKF